MRLTIFNGSPRGRRSNTDRLLQPFLRGFLEQDGNRAEVVHLTRARPAQEQLKAFEEAECILFAFPLYIDAMPSHVMAFIEELAPRVGKMEGVPIAFLVHCGFPEARHCRAVEQYLVRLALRLKCTYLGTLIKGGTEGMAAFPIAYLGTFRAFRRLGRFFGQTGKLELHAVRALAWPERYGPLSVLSGHYWFNRAYRNRYWDDDLRANGVFGARHATPDRDD